MIQNPKIFDKIENKTSGDSIMKSFLLAIIENESEGKQYSKFFKSMIEKSVKEKNDQGGMV